jgi:hypothetical protein
MGDAGDMVAATVDPAGGGLERRLTAVSASAWGASNVGPALTSICLFRQLGAVAPEAPGALRGRVEPAHQFCEVFFRPMSVRPMLTVMRSSYAGAANGGRIARMLCRLTPSCG